MKPGKIGILSAALASVCCVGPVVLVLLGLGALGFGAFLGKYHWFFLTSAVVILIYAWRVYAREQRRCDAERCEMESRRPAVATLVGATLVVAFFAALNVYTHVLSRPVEAEAAPPAPTLASVTLPLEGLVCFTCELAVESGLNKVDGVVSAKASVKNGSVLITYDPQKVNVDKLVEAVNKTGYKATLPPGRPRAHCRNAGKAAPGGTC